MLNKTIVEIKESRYSWERYKLSYKGEDEGSCYDNPELTRHPNTTKPVNSISLYKLKVNLRAKSV